MNKKYVNFFKKVSKVDGFLPIQFIILFLCLYFGVKYVYWVFQKPSDEAYNAKFENYSGLLVLVNIHKGNGKGGGGVGGRIVIEGDKGRIEFRLNHYSTYSQQQDLPYFLGKRRFNLTHYKNNIVSCNDDQGGVCIPKCDSPINCEISVIQKNREMCFYGLLISLFISVIIFLVASIEVLIKDKFNV